MLAVASSGEEEADLGGDRQVWQQVARPLGESPMSGEAEVVVAGVDPVDPESQCSFEEVSLVTRPV